MDITIIGHIMKEMIQFSDYTLGPVLGGPAAYSSVVSACLGAQVGLVTRIGPDMPDELLKPLFQAGVDTRGMRRGLESRHSLLIYDDKGNKTMQYPKTGEGIQFNDIPEEYFEANIIYVATLEGEVSLKIVDDISSRAPCLAIDLGGYGGAHCSKETVGRQNKLIRRLLGNVCIAKGSREDCGYLFPEKEYRDEELAHILVDMGAKVGIITCGKDGVVIATIEGKKFSIPSFSTNVVDCTGAGDAFSAGFLFSYQRGNNIMESAVFASSVASLLIEKTGGITIERMPKLAQVEKRVSMFKRKMREVYEE